MPDYLYAMPSFVAGFARTLDVFATFDSYNNSRTTQQADARALYTDWKAVGKEIMHSYQKVKAENPEPTPSAAQQGEQKK